MLPYQPPMDISSCASPATSYEGGTANAKGQRRLDLISNLTLPSNQLDSDETYAALQAAVLTHFEALFLRRGYRRVEVDYGNARVRYYQSTQHMLQGHAVTKEDEEADSAPPLPPIPYIKLARYVRTEAGHDITLTFRSDAKNTWVIQIDGLPDSAASGGKP